MKPAKKLIIGSILLTTLGFFWLREPALSPEAEVWLEAARKPESDNSIYDSYFEWAGIEAENGADTRAVGKRIVDDFINSNEGSQYIKTYPILPDSFANTELSDLIVLPDEQIEKLLKDNDIFIQRYNKLLKNPVILLGHWGSSSYIPKIENLKNAQKLQWLSWAHQLRNTTVNSTVNSEIENNFIALQQQIKTSDFLLGKMIFNVLLKEHLFFHQQLQKSGFSIVNKYPLLDTKSRSLNNILEYEFYSSKELLSSFKQQKDTNNKIDLSENSNKMLDILFKPNFLLNQQQKAYATIAMLSEEKPHVILSAKHEEVSIPPLAKWTAFYDPLSHIISQIKTPSYRPYMLRLLETNCLIDSFNYTEGTEISVKASSLEYCHTYTWKDANYR